MLARRIEPGLAVESAKYSLRDWLGLLQLARAEKLSGKSPTLFFLSPRTLFQLTQDSSLQLDRLADHCFSLSEDASKLECICDIEQMLRARFD
jgi:hypothetical protein